MENSKTLTDACGHHCGTMQVGKKSYTGHCDCLDCHGDAKKYCVWITKSDAVNAFLMDSTPMSLDYCLQIGSRWLDTHPDYIVMLVEEN